MAQTNPYTYVKPSELATRTLISDDPSNKPTMTPSAGSHDHDVAADRPVLVRKTTDNYNQAVANAGKESTVTEGRTAAAQGAADATGTDPAAATTADRPGMRARQPSWDLRDKRREHHEQYLNSAKVAPTSGPHTGTS